MKSIAERVKFIRESKNLSQKDFSKSLDISQGVISDIEHGRKGVSRNVLVALGTQYRVNATWLLTGEGEPTMPPPQQLGSAAVAIQAIKNADDALINTAGLLGASAPPETEAAAEPPAELSAKEKANTRAAITMLENAAQSIEAAVKLLKESMGDKYGKEE